MTLASGTGQRPHDAHSQPRGLGTRRLTAKGLCRWDRGKGPLQCLRRPPLTTQVLQSRGSFLARSERWDAAGFEDGGRGPQAKKWSRLWKLQRLQRETQPSQPRVDLRPGDHWTPDLGSLTIKRVVLERQQETSTASKESSAVGNVPCTPTPAPSPLSLSFPGFSSPLTPTLSADNMTGVL